jgi:putative heme transporter
MRDPRPVTSPPDILRAKILIVDNQDVNVVLLEQLLQDAGYVSVTSTTDSRTVCALHRQHHYDLILLDLQMPGLDGFQVMEGLKALGFAGDLPVLVITAQPDHQRRALQAGAKDFLTKPLDLGEVLRRVHSILETRIPTEPSRKRDLVTLPERKVLRFEFAPVTFAWLGAAVVGLWLIFQLWRIMLIVVVAFVLVGTFNPVIKALEARGIKRRSALVVLMVSLSVIGALLIFLTVPALVGQLTTIVENLPHEREQLIDVLGRHKFGLPFSHALNNLGLDQLYARLQHFLIGYWVDVLRVAGYCVTTFCLSIYLLADGKRTQGLLYAVVPRPYHMRLASIIHRLEEIVGGYMRGQLITSVSIAAFTFLLLMACGVRNALALALFAALMDLLPFVGGFLAIVPSVLAALGRGSNTAIVVVVCLWLYQQFDNKILVPRVYGQTLRLSPAIVILALMAGWTLLGVLGSLLALPIAAGLQMLIHELGVELPGDDSRNPVTQARNDKTEAAYELMSSGATPPDAGEIANELAHGLRDADAWVAASAAKKKKADRVS